MRAYLPERLRIELGPAQFSGPVVGPHDAYLREAGALAIFKSPECLSLAARGAVRSRRPSRVRFLLP